MNARSILPILVCALMLAADADARGGRGFSFGRSFRAPAAPRIFRPSRAPAPAPAPARAPAYAHPPAKAAPRDDDSSFGSAFVGGAAGGIVGGLIYDAVTDNESGAVVQPQNPCYPYEPNCSKSDGD